MGCEILIGDCCAVMRAMAGNSVDSIVTDPPYGLSFMGKKWDYDVPSVEIWREVFRVLKPGGHLLAFGGTRTYHRLVVAIEDAGFEIRDQIQWLYGQGFPKSLDISKAIDKAAGAEREVIGVAGKSSTKTIGTIGHVGGEYMSTAPSTASAKQWSGWGTALKPANEPIVLARKPLEKGLTVAQNVQKWGTGGLNIDGCRVGTEQMGGQTVKGSYGSPEGHFGGGKDRDREFVAKVAQGRFPANVILDETAAAALDEQVAQTMPGMHVAGNKKLGSARKTDDSIFGMGSNDGPVTLFDSSDTKPLASRFFYCAKASTKERNAGLDGMPKGILATSTGQTRPNQPARLGADPHAVQKPVANTHPTVKPVKLMSYLCHLITPPNGTVLDPFAGSGSTGVAAKQAGFNFIGIELNPEYAQIAKARVKNAV